MAELHIKIQYKEKDKKGDRELKWVKHKPITQGGWEKKWRKLTEEELPNHNLPSDNDGDLIKLWPEEHSCRYVYHNGRWYTNC